MQKKGPRGKIRRPEPSVQAAPRIKSPKLPLGVKISAPIDLERFLPYRIYRLASKTSAPRFATLFGAVKIRAREWRILLILATLGPLTNVDIAKRTAMDTGNVARGIKELLRLKFVVARTPKSDRRKQVVTLTPSGAYAHDQIAPQRATFSQQLLLPLSKKERHEFFGILSRIERRADELIASDPGIAADDEWD